jgi:hypothetical protein
MQNTKFIAAIFLFSLAGFAFSSAQEFSLYNAERKMIYSEYVQDSFHIFISLPENYNESKQLYPVFYVLDGDVVFGIAAGIARYLQIGGNIPELIVVGIGYGSTDKSAGNKRSRDFRALSTGGAENFLNFLKSELIPYIDNNYRTAAGERTISGYSLAGLFALYTLFTEPKLFNRYTIGSPYLQPGNYKIFDFEEQAVEMLNEVDANIFISVGSEESEKKYFNPVDSLVTKIEERNYQGLNLETKVFHGSTHLMGPPESLTHGLISVLRK